MQTRAQIACRERNCVQHQSYIKSLIFRRLLQFILYGFVLNRLATTRNLKSRLPQRRRSRRRQQRKRVGNIKNCDRNGPEGQSIAVGSTVCNAGLPPYSKVFLISLEPIKVSMKKKEEEKSKEWREWPPIYRWEIWSVHAGKLSESWQTAERLM